MPDYPSVTKILVAAGLIDMSCVPKDILERALQFGSAVHKAVELNDLGTLDRDKLSPPLLPYLEGWQKFLKDYNIVIEPSELEKQFTSVKYGFTGKPDRWPIIKGKRTIVEIKSSTIMIPATEIQSAGYQILLEEAGIKIQQCWGLQLLGEVPEGKLPYCIEPYKDNSDKATFLNCLGLYNFKKRKGILK